MTWEKLVELIMKLVEECLSQGESEDAIRRRLTRPNWWDWRRLRVAIRQETNLYGKSLRQIMADVRAEHADASIDERVQFATQCIAAAKQED